MNTRWMGLNLSPLISMNIQEGGQENVVVFWLLSHRSSVAGSTAGQMTEREGEGDMEERGRYVCVWDLKGTAPGCLGYLFLSKAMQCLEKEASCVLDATVGTRSIVFHLP